MFRDETGAPQKDKSILDRRSTVILCVRSSCSVQGVSQWNYWLPFEVFPLLEPRSCNASREAPEHSGSTIGAVRWSGRHPACAEKGGSTTSAAPRSCNASREAPKKMLDLPKKRVSVVHRRVGVPVSVVGGCWWPWSGPAWSSAQQHRFLIRFFFFGEGRRPKNRSFSQVSPHARSTVYGESWPWFGLLVGWLFPYGFPSLSCWGSDVKHLFSSVLLPRSSVALSLDGSTTIPCRGRKFHNLQKY